MSVSGYLLFNELHVTNTAACLLIRLSVIKGGVYCRLSGTFALALICRTAI